VNEDSLEERLDARMIRTIKDLDTESFKRLMSNLLSTIGVKVTASAVADDLVFMEGDREGDRFLVMASRRPGHASREGLRLIKEKAALEGRAPILLVTGDMDKEGGEFAVQNDISFADRGKLLTLLKKYQLTEPLMREIDRKIMEQEGTRFLPSIGQFDSLLQAGDEAMQEGRWKEAVEALGKALQLKPEHDLAWRLKAIAHMNLEEGDEALECMRRAIQIRPSDPNHHYTLGLVFHSMGRLQEELRSYEEALRYQRRMPSALLNKGATQYALGRKEDALKTFDEMLRYYPGDLRAMNNRGLVLRSLGRTDEALEAFESVVARDPTYQDALLNKAALLSERGNVMEAVNAWKEVVNADRQRSDMWIHLGQAQKAAGLIAEAAKSFEVAATLDAHNQEAVAEREQTRRVEQVLTPQEVESIAKDDGLVQKYLAAALLLQAVGEYGEALREVDRCMSFQPRDPEAYLRRAAIMMDLGRIEEAIATLMEGLREHPKDRRIILDLEAITNRLGRKEECLRLLSDPGDSLEASARVALLNISLGKGANALTVLAWPAGKEYVHDYPRALALMSRGRYQEAAEMFAQMEAWFQGSPQLLNGLGACLRYTGQFNEAEEALYKAVEAEPRYADAWNNLGCVHYLRASYEEAERCLREAVLIDRDPDYLLNLAMCQLGRNDLEGANASFELALTLAESAEALNGLGIVAERKKENARALERYEAALKISPEFRDAQYNRARVRMLLKGE
jgi:tetratricopeptide (TPR) repeat protein